MSQITAAPHREWSTVHSSYYREMAHVSQWLMSRLAGPVVERVVKRFRRSKAASTNLHSYGRTPVGEPLPHAGVLWIIERDDPALYSRIAPTPAPDGTVRLLVNPTPICPTPG